MDNNNSSNNNNNNDNNNVAWPPLTAPEYYNNADQATEATQQQPQPQQYRLESDDIVQVVYHSNQNGSLVGIESSYLNGTGQANGNYQFADNGQQLAEQTTHSALRSSSTLPSVAEESTASTSGSGGAGASLAHISPPENVTEAARLVSESISSSQYNDNVFASSDINEQNNFTQVDNYQEQLNYSNATTATFYDDEQQQQQQQQESHDFLYNPNAIYSTINKQKPTESTNYRNEQFPIDNNLNDSQTTNSTSTTFYTANTFSSNPEQQASISGSAPIVQQQTDSADTSSGTLQKHSPIKELQEEEEQAEAEIEVEGKHTTELNQEEDEDEEDEKEEKENFSKFLTRQKGGAAESGSFRKTFRKLGVSQSTNENDLIAHRQKLLEEQEGVGSIRKVNNLDLEETEGDEIGGLLPSSKFKRTHSVSFNVGGSRNSRHSVDIRNLPSYLTHKRASIVDVAKGAMSSLIHSFGASGASVSSAGHRRNSSIDEPEEPIFEEPIAPTLSLGQRVALVRNSGAEFGTVGWIGQLPDVDDDWIVGVIFDNMIGNCDGEHLGVRYFYARENYAMFVPLSSLTKTDNYIGRPETGTMLSRMSVSLKPGQLISIHRSSIRLQHCFLNAPHQRVGHDVRAVSNRLHCQCHNCGPCAHLTKQGRAPHAPPLLGSHHAPNKKNSLAHMAVELLAHHHHHYHDEEEHEEEDHQFGENSAHACNFVRYSCCQQSGTDGHEFSADCQMVRPELLDNLIHAPRAPHRRSRLRRSRQAKLALSQQQQCQPAGQQITALEQQQQQQQQIDPNHQMDQYQQDTLKQSSIQSARSESSYSSCSSATSNSPELNQQNQQSTYDNYNTSNQYYQNNILNYTMQTNQTDAYSTMDSQISYVDQRRYISRRDSSTNRSRQSYTSDEYYMNPQNVGLGNRIRRCFACILGRPKSNNRKRRPKKGKMSARNRMIEYRRRQSTFVPSTLAKPQEDFASHGIILSNNQNNNDSNSDYSSYTASGSGDSSRSHSPDRPGGGTQIAAETYQQQTMTYEQQSFNNEQQLKSRADQQSNQINYGDYTINSDNNSIYKKDDASYSRESALTDLGYYDTWTSNSNDTLKKIVDDSINEQEPLRYEPSNDIVSPMLSTDGSHISDHIEISSPTASIVDQVSDGNINGIDEQQENDVSQMINQLHLDNIPKEE